MPFPVILLQASTRYLTPFPSLEGKIPHKNFHAQKESCEAHNNVTDG